MHIPLIYIISTTVQFTECYETAFFSKQQLSLLSLPISVPASPHSIMFLGNMESWGKGKQITICVIPVHTAETVSIIMRVIVHDARRVPK